MSKRIVAIIKLAILAAILFWLFKSFPSEHWKTLAEQPKNWGWLGFALSAVMAANLISFLRWRLLVRALDVPFTVVDAIRLGFLGCLFNLVSAGSVGGDLFKAIAAARKAEKKRPEVVGSVIVDRAVGLLGLVMVAAFSLQFLATESLSEKMEWIRQGAWALSAVGIVGLGVIVFFGKWLPLSWLSKMPFVGHAFYRMAHAGLIFYGRGKLVCVMLAISLAVHSCLTLSTYWVSTSLYAESPSLREHFLVIPPAMAAGALPLTPGGLGVQEAAIQKLFEQLPNPPEHFSGLVTAAMYRLLTFVVAGVGAIYYFFGAQDLQWIRKNSSPSMVSKNQ
ncbi:MAG: lysylphosphatidylglycerol synthase transmembrane domain-containing protein [Pirellulales bacterium]